MLNLVLTWFIDKKHLYHKSQAFFQWFNIEGKGTCEFNLQWWVFSNIHCHTLLYEKK